MRRLMKSLQLPRAPPSAAPCCVPRRRKAIHSAAAAAVPHRQDRISSDGSWWSSAAANTSNTPEAAQLQRQAQPYVIGSAVGAAADTAPLLPPVSGVVIDQLAEVLQDARGALVLTGAGCSTESSIPDYRGPAGAYTLSNFKPMTHQQFMASPENRSRYWARSFAGWFKFSSVAPNAAHESIARLQNTGWAHALITQNVDRLHHKAGSPDVLELHGTTHRVVCMGCGSITCREEMQQRLADLNPEAASAAAALATERDAADDRARLLRAGTAAAVHPSLREKSSSSEGGRNGGSSGSSGGIGTSPGGLTLVQRPDSDAQPVQRPDGDMELTGGGQGFRVPACTTCGGILKPHVVFFGDGIPPERAHRALDLAQSCRSMLVVGSSLAVWSAYRLAKAAVENGAQLVIVTAGPTRADDLAHLKVEGRAGEVLSRLAAHPSLQVPPMY